MRWPLATVLSLCTLIAGCAVTPPGSPDNISAIFREKDDWHEAAKAVSER